MSNKIRIISPPDHSKVPPFVTLQCHSEHQTGYKKEVHIDGYIYSKIHGNSIVIPLVYEPTPKHTITVYIKDQDGVIIDKDTIKVKCVEEEYFSKSVRQQVERLSDSTESTRCDPSVTWSAGIP